MKEVREKEREKLRLASSERLPKPQNQFPINSNL